MRPTGLVKLFERDQLLWERRNIFVNSGLPALANLIAGVTTGQYVTVMGFGSGASMPLSSDTALGATPTYFNQIGASTFPSSGSVEFNYSLLTADYGATGMTIQELGLFANSTGIGLPSAQGTANAQWSANTAKTAGAMIVDSNGNLQLCSISGTTGGTAPLWATSLNATTADNAVSWKLVAFHEAPTPLIAHVTVPAFAYTGTGNYSGTWTLTF